MDFEKFLNELDSLNDGRAEKIAEIKRHGLPVMIFGASLMAQKMKNILSDFGVEVAGFAVDKEYFTPNQTFLDLPIYNFDELRGRPYVFVLGMNSDWLDGDRSWKFMHDEKIIRYALLDHAYEPIDKNFIARHGGELEHVFNLVADDFSRETLVAYLRTVITWEPTELWQIFRRGVTSTS